MSSIADDVRQRLLLRRVTVALIVVGVTWRVLRYLLCLPIWGDEAMLCVNLLNQDYLGLTQRLQHCQVAPILFLWGQLTALHWWGGSELAMRLLPFCAGMGALFLFWRLARLTLPPLAATLAFGFLAVAIWPVSMCTFAKPYSMDLLLALALILPAAHWLQNPRELRWLVLLVCVVPAAIFGSYPAVFIAGGVSLGLLSAVWRQQEWKPRLLFAAYNVVLLASFAGNFLTVGKNQLQTKTSTATTEADMKAYWADAFPPSSPWAFVKWFVFIHTGQMTAYPLGSQDGGSSLTTLLCLVGAWNLWTSRRRALLVLCAAPFALGFLAALLHRYPYGGSGRLSQHVAPAICLTAGLGAAVLIERVQSAVSRQRWIVGVCTFFVLIGIGGMVRDVIKPYRDQETKWMRQVIRDLAAEARSGVPIVVLNEAQEMDTLFAWHLGQFGDRLVWNGRIDWDKARANREMVFVRFWTHDLLSPEEFVRTPTQESARIPADLEMRLEQSKQRWVVKQAVTDTGSPRKWNDPVKHLDRFRWVLEETDQSARIARDENGNF